MDKSDSCQSERFYLPSLKNGIGREEYLERYIEREFPKTTDSIYSIPTIYKKNGEKQATVAEEIVFQRLHGLKTKPNHKLWLLFFHSASYGGRSFRNQRIGKLMMREHDFVVFVQHEDKKYFALMEVKSSCDLQKLNEDGNIKKMSDSKLIKNNKRSAQHQLRDHCEILMNLIENNTSNCIQKYIMWPFLPSNTKSPQNEVSRRWSEDGRLHLFEDVLQNQDKFNHWFYDVILNGNTIADEQFNTFLNRFIILSSGVFVHEIEAEMMALLTQEQRNLLYKTIDYEKKALVVYGAAGTGKTLLVLKKLEELHATGRLNDKNRALYICYWPGIRFDFEQKLTTLGLKPYVDTCRFYITFDAFETENRKPYRHIFMDESEALCLAFDPNVVHVTMATIYGQFHAGNCPHAHCTHHTLNVGEELSEKLESHPNVGEESVWGELWFMADGNQASLSLPRNSPAILKKPTLILGKVMRSTGYIFEVFKQFYSVPMPALPLAVRSRMCIPRLVLGHAVRGPPVQWAEAEQDAVGVAARVVVDLCASRGFRPKDVCVLPFLCNERLEAANFNRCIDAHFAEGAYRPRCVQDVEYYLGTDEPNCFLLAWALRVKGLEFKVVVMVVDEDDFDCADGEDRRKAYIIVSRCTSMLVLVSNGAMRAAVVGEAFEEYAFDQGAAASLTVS